MSASFVYVSYCILASILFFVLKQFYNISLKYCVICQILKVTEC